MFILTTCYQITPEDARPEFRRDLVTHVLETRHSALESTCADDEEKTFAWKTIGSVYYQEDRWTEAEELDVQVMETKKRVLGREHPFTLTSMNNLA
ncbi:hypothetical protein BDY21DRAFT_21377 [Lineolata rhizophorae]|uniref:Kinesin light chain n=1 Tax=Lineolata rhizophorae TaxID=578093 RepID=A0A6A6P2Q8_9PEZI|nr:hypothetical protein BDY21DRAFT_21377 [Lineolata rhizophorae]